LYEDGSSRLSYRDSPFAFAAVDGTGADRLGALNANRAGAPALIAYPFDLKERVRRAESETTKNPPQAAAYLNLAKLLHFEMYWIQGAPPLYEKVLELDPGRTDVRWRLIDIYRNTTDIDGEERQYLVMLKHDPADYFAKHYYDWLRKTYYWAAAFGV
jgi:hypothetical protein